MRAEDEHSVRCDVSAHDMGPAFAASTKQKCPRLSAQCDGGSIGVRASAEIDAPTHGLRSPLEAGQ